MSGWFDMGINMPDKRLPEQQIFDAASEQEVNGVLLIGTDVNQSTVAHDIACQRGQYVVSTVGVHPHNAKNVSANYLVELTNLSANEKVVAIGECGLDFNRNFSPPEDQLRVFEQQLILASELQLPVYLHERDAFDSQITLLKKYANSLSGAVVHCFTGSIEQMQAYLDLGFYIGITGWVCDDKRGRELQQAVKQLPLQRLLLETDAPYLFPKTLKPRASSNQPANLPHIARQVAHLMDVELSELQQHAWRNSLKFLSLESASVA